MDSFEVGNRVKITEDDLPYAGTIITYDDTHYKVSVDGLGKVTSFEESDLTLLPGGSENFPYPYPSEAKPYDGEFTNLPLWSPGFAIEYDNVYNWICRWQVSDGLTQQTGVDSIHKMWRFYVPSASMCYTATTKATMTFSQTGYAGTFTETGVEYNNTGIYLRSNSYPGQGITPSPSLCFDSVDDAVAAILAQL